MSAEEVINGCFNAELLADVLSCLLEVVLTRAEEGLFDFGNRRGIPGTLNGLELQEDDSTETPILEGYVVEVLGVQVCLNLVEDVFDCHRVSEHAE